MFLLLRGECLSAEANQTMCLSGFGGAIDSIRLLTSSLLRKVGVLGYITYATYTTLAALTALVGILLLKGRCASWIFLYIVAIGLSLWGDLAAYQKHPGWVIAAHSLALLSALVALFLALRSEGREAFFRWITPEEYQSTPRPLEVMTSVSIFVWIALTRFYALNRIPTGWDAETCPHRAIATSWYRMTEQELGAHVQQSSGMFWVILHNLFTRLEDPLLFLLDERILGVGISLLNCWAVYFMVRYVSGAFAAILALLVYGLGPLDLEWSRLPTLHHLPVAIGLLLTWATFMAFGRRTWGAFCAVLVLIVATKFVYPSAKLIALGPVLGMCGAIMWERRAWIGEKKKLLAIPLGILGFAGIRSLVMSIWHGSIRIVPPVQIPPQSNQPSSLMDTASFYVRELSGFFIELFYTPYSPTHWTIPASVEPYRSLPSICVVLSVLVFARLLLSVRSPYALICAGFMIGGLVPAIVIGLADRRIAFSLVLLSILGSIELAWFLRTAITPHLPRVADLARGVIVLVVGLALLSLQTTGFFSRPSGIPIQIAETQRLRPLVKPGTLVMLLAEEHRCELFYGVLDLLRGNKGKIAFATANDSAKGPREMIETPSVTYDAWYYQLTDLTDARALSQEQKTAPWPGRVLYAFQYIPSRQEWVDRLQTRYPAGKGMSYDLETEQRQVLYVFDTMPEGSH